MFLSVDRADCAGPPSPHPLHYPRSGEREQGSGTVAGEGQQEGGRPSVPGDEPDGSRGGKYLVHAQLIPVLGFKLCSHAPSNDQLSSSAYLTKGLRMGQVSYLPDMGLGWGSLPDLGRGQSKYNKG